MVVLLYPGRVSLQKPALVDVHLRRRSSPDFRRQLDITIGPVPRKCRLKLVYLPLAPLRPCCGLSPLYVLFCCLPGPLGTHLLHVFLPDVCGAGVFRRERQRTKGARLLARSLNRRGRNCDTVGVSEVEGGGPLARVGVVAQSAFE